MENNDNKVEELNSQIKALKRMVKNGCVQKNYDVKKVIEQQIDDLERELMAERCHLRKKDLVGRYFKSRTNGLYDEYYFVRSLKDVDIVCDRICYSNIKNSYEHALHVDLKAEFSYIEPKDLEEITKEEFFEVYHKICKTLVETGLGI